MLRCVRIREIIYVTFNDSSVYVSRLSLTQPRTHSVACLRARTRLRPCTAQASSPEQLEELEKAAELRHARARTSARAQETRTLSLAHTHLDTRAARAHVHPCSVTLAHNHASARTHTPQTRTGRNGGATTETLRRRRRLGTVLWPCCRARRTDPRSSAQPHSADPMALLAARQHCLLGWSLVDYPAQTQDIS